MELGGKTAIITGAGDGLGQQIAMKLGKAGSHLALIGRDKKKLETTKKMIQETKASVFVCDISDIKACKKTVEAIYKEFSSIDVLVNNAGIWHTPSPLEDIDDKLFQQVIGINFLGTIQFTKYVLPHLKSQPEAAIVNIISKSGLVSPMGQSVYAASKWGVRGFAEVLREDLKGTCIRICNVYQGGMKTAFFQKANDMRPTDKYIDPVTLADMIVSNLSHSADAWLNEIKMNV